MKEYNLINDGDVSAFMICISPSIVDQLSIVESTPHFKVNEMIVSGDKIEYQFYQFILKYNNSDYQYIASYGSESTLTSIKRLVRSAL